MRKISLFLILVGLFSCKNKEIRVYDNHDPHSFAIPDSAKVTHLKLDITVDFFSKKIIGKATYNIDRKTDEIVFDTRKLSIIDVKDGETKESLAFILKKEDPILGRALKVKLAPETKVVEITYATSSHAAALQWLEPEQTADKKSPFLYTQSQAILARSWIPCQDGPGVRFTYEAKVKVPSDMIAVMSASNPVSKNDSGIYYFRQDKPIPSYLMALAAGDFEFRSLGENCGVYAEHSMIDKCAAEFTGLPKMISAAEKLYGPYQWGRYDVLVLPPSFPFGGMENPEVTFATPTIIAGDRSLVSLIAHELAHSWSGNLVTNSNWNDFWLNEGFTVYFERRIMEAVEGKEYADMLQVLGYQDLVQELDELGRDNPDTRLKLDLAGRDPDDGLTDIAYEKGAALLCLMEQRTGRIQFDIFLRKYFTENAFKPMNTEKFIDYYKKELVRGDQNISNAIQIEKWIYEPGLPKNCPEFKSARLTNVQETINKWKEEPAIKAYQSTLSWSSHEWLYFLRGINGPLSHAQLEDLYTNKNFGGGGNSELQAEWLLIVIKNKFSPDYPALEKFLSEVGRRKFLMPLYSELIKDEEGKAFAKKIYKNARKNYHYVSVTSLDALLKN